MDLFLGQDIAVVLAYEDTCYEGGLWYMEIPMHCRIHPQKINVKSHAVHDVFMEPTSQSQRNKYDMGIKCMTVFSELIGKSRHVIKILWTQIIYVRTISKWSTTQTQIQDNVSWHSDNPSEAKYEYLLLLLIICVVLSRSMHQLSIFRLFGCYNQVKVKQPSTGYWFAPIALRDIG